jgi:type IV pilus assembly protein PilA
VTYNNTYPGTFAALSSLGPGAAVCGTPASANACLIDNLLANATSAAKAKSGYWFTYAGATATPAVGGCTGFQTYTFVGVPANCGQTGQRGFFTDQSGVIRFTTDCSAPTLASPPIQ